MKTSRFVSVFSFLGSYVWVSEWVSAKGESVKYVSSTNRTIAQAYCPGLLPSTIACLILSTYIEIAVSNLTWGPLLEFFIVVLLLVFFFLERGAIHPYPKKMRGEGWKLDDQASIVLVRLNACLTRNIWERSECSVRCLFVLSSHEPRATSHRFARSQNGCLYVIFESVHLLSFRYVRSECRN